MDSFADEVHKEKWLLLTQGESMTFKERGVTNCGIVQDDYFEGNNTFYIMVYEPRKSDALILKQTTEKN